MPIITCHCGTRLNVADHLLGKRVKCSSCGQILQTQAPVRAPLVAEVIQEPVAAVTSNAPAEQGIPWARWLAECQQRFGKAPRSFDSETSGYLKIEGGCLYSLLFWIPMCKLLKGSRQREIFRDGVVVWGHIIQANMVLFSPSQDQGDDAPGELVFAVDPSSRVTPEYLEGVAERLGSLRGSQNGNPELDQIGAYLEAETVRAFGWNVPQAISANVPCFISTTIFLRKHLPGGFLNKSFFPIVVSQGPTHFAMPLPERYWSPELKSWWMTP